MTFRFELFILFNLMTWAGSRFWLLATVMIRLFSLFVGMLVLMWFWTECFSLGGMLFAKINIFFSPQRFYSSAPNGLLSIFSSKQCIEFTMIHWSYLTERNILCILDTVTHDRSFYSLATNTLIFSFMYRHWHISFLPNYETLCKCTLENVLCTCILFQMGLCEHGSKYFVLSD